MAEQKLVEDLLQSIQIVASGLDSKVNKDVTTLCEIVNVDRASEGIYIVKEQEAKYEAYSESKFEVGDQVYVTIPKGDYNEQKLIMGKKVAENTTPFNWISPFDSFFKIIDWNTSRATGVGDEGGLLANGTTEEIEVIPWTNANATGFDRLGLKAGFKNNLTSCVSGNYGLRLELQVTNYFDTNAKTTKIVPYVLEVADMWGNPYNFPSYFAQEKVFELDSDKDITIEKWRLIFFQDKDSFMDEDGNLYPVEINTGIGQSRPMPNNLFVDDIEISLGYEAEETYGDKVYLFCANGTNYGSGNSTASVKAMFAEIATMQSYLADPNTSATGRAYYEALISTYQEKIKTIITPEAYAVYMSKPVENRDSYLNSLHIDGINEKQLKARWWHLDEDGNGMVIDENPEFVVGASVNLYRFNSKAIADELGGPAYELIATHGPYQNANGKRTPLDFTFIPDPNKEEEHLKIVIYKYGENDRLDAEGNPVKDSQGVTLKELEYAYSSDILILTNDNGVKDETMTALRIKPEDDYRGIYNIYDATTWELTDITEGKIPRKLHLYFSSENLSLKYLDKADSVVWTVPRVETMVVFDNMPAADLVVNTEDGLFTEYHYLKKYTHAADNTDEDYDTERLNISYCIDFSYIAGYTNNIVSCRVLRDGITYNAQFEFKFGMRGNVSDGNVILFTLGDDYNNITTANNGNVTGGTLVEPRVQAWTRSSSQFISIIRRFYNKNGEELNPTWSTLTHYAGDQLFEQASATIRNISMVGIKLKSGVSEAINMDTTMGEIMTCTATVDGIVYNVYLAIPIRSWRQLISINGPKQIYFDHNGYNPDGTDKYFTCWCVDEQHGFHSAVGRGSVTKPSGAEGSTNFSDCLPILYSSGGENEEKRYYLKAPGQFFTDLAPYSYAVQLNYTDDVGMHKWVQPILITINPYDNSILNEWDGKLKIDEENNYILASMMGAGWKDKENHFTGAIMGVVDNITQNTTQKLPSNTGLFGFDGGIGAFAFKADGTAYIGKAGTARINFNGNAGTIENAGYGNASSGGMHIDLTGNTNSGQRPWINMHAANGAAVYIGTGGGTTPTTSNPDPIPRTNMYFRIKAPKRTGDTDGPILMQIGNQQQFIQTANYTLPSRSDTTSNGTTTINLVPGAGMRINLVDGTIVSYDKLTLQGGNLQFTGDYKQKTVNGVDVNDPNYPIWKSKSGSPFIYLSNELFRSNSTIRDALDIKNKHNNVSDVWLRVAGEDHTDWKLVIGENFGVESNGRLVASGGAFAGTITAQAGKIGGWDILTGQIRGSFTDANDGNKIKYTAMQAPTGTNEWVFAAGGIATDSYRAYPFRVSKKGTLYAENAHIKGEVTATSGTFTGTVSGSAIEGGSISIGSNFSVDGYGNLTASGASLSSATVSGTLTAGAGSQIGGWNVNAASLSGDSGVKLVTNGLSQFWYGLQAGRPYNDNTRPLEVNNQTVTIQGYRVTWQKIKYFDFNANEQKEYYVLRQW